MEDHAVPLGQHIDGRINDLKELIGSRFDSFDRMIDDVHSDVRRMQESMPNFATREEMENRFRAVEEDTQRGVRVTEDLTARVASMEGSHNSSADVWARIIAGVATLASIGEFIALISHIKR